MVRRPGLAAAAVAALVLAACSGGGDDAGGATTASSTSSTVASTVPSTTTTVAPLTPAEVLDAVGPSVAFLSLDGFGAGSALLIDDGMLVTNAHVVGTEPTMDVAFADGTRVADVPVVGVDLVRDLAVLGPVETDREPVRFGESDGLGSGDELYLIGFPGEPEDEGATPEPTITRGILSRIRTSEDFAVRFLQTDATIAGGQSGGALVADDGTVVGLSGLSFAGDFAVALSVEDVRAGIERILANEPGTRIATFGEAERRTEGMLAVFDRWDEAVLSFFNDTDRTVTLRLSFTADAPLSITGLVDGAVEFLNEVAIDRLVAAELAEADQLPDPDEPVEPGVWEAEVPADGSLYVALSREADGAGTIGWTSSVALWQAPATQVSPISVGSTVDGAIEPSEDRDVHLVDLAEGQAVEITAISAVGDMFVAVRRVDAPIDMDALFDDDDLGVLGLDARGVYVAETAGTYAVVVADSNGGSAAYRLTITASS